MKLDLDNTAGKQIISAYEMSEIVINGTAYHHNLIVWPEAIIHPWKVDEFSELALHNFEALLPMKPELILLGTGAKFQIPSAELRTDLFQLGIAMEFMDTHAACRTYNILALENRRVAAALII